jgi:hypothetical protein
MGLCGLIAGTQGVVRGRFEEEDGWSRGGVLCTERGSLLDQTTERWNAGTLDPSRKPACAISPSPPSAPSAQDFLLGYYWNLPPETSLQPSFPSEQLRDTFNRSRVMFSPSASAFAFELRCFCIKWEQGTEKVQLRASSLGCEIHAPLATPLGQSKDSSCNYASSLITASS